MVKERFYLNSSNDKVLHGLQECYTSNGELFQILNYEHGKQFGIQLEWSISECRRLIHLEFLDDLEVKKDDLKHIQKIWPGYRLSNQKYIRRWHNNGLPLLYGEVLRIDGDLIRKTTGWEDDGNKICYVEDNLTKGEVREIIWNNSGEIICDGISLGLFCWNGSFYNHKTNTLSTFKDGKLIDEVTIEEKVNYMLINEINSCWMDNPM
jgi:hypothetical protein